MRLLLLVLPALLLSTPADAQRRDRDRPAPDPFGEAGAFALAFSAGWLSVGPFLGGVGGRYWLTDRTVLTTSVRASVTSADLDPTSDDPQPDNEQDAFELGLSVGAEQHFGRSTRVSPFVALGVDGAAWRREDDRTFPDGGSSASTYRTQVLGGSVFVGVEYRFAPSLTLAAAHAFGASYEWGEQSNTLRIPGEEPMVQALDLSTFRLGTSTTTLTLSVYF